MNARYLPTLLAAILLAVSVPLPALANDLVEDEPAAKPADRTAADAAPAQNAAPATEAAAPEKAAQTPKAAADEDQEVAPDDPDKTEFAKLNTSKIEWYDRIRTHVTESMVGASTAKYREAEKTLLEITDPNALEPMALVLYNRNTRWRSSFVKVARQFAQAKDPTAGPLAVAYLSDVAVADPNPVLRGAARSAMLAPDTPRLADRLKVQLATNNDADARSRAAALLADLKDNSMLHTMVDLLVTEEWRLVSKMIETRSVEMDVRTQVALPPDLSRTTTVQAAGLVQASAQVTLPTVKVTALNTSVVAPAGYTIVYEWERVRVAHSGILGALRKLTSKDFGYDQDAWLKWLTEQNIKSDPRAPRSKYDVQWDDDE